MNKTEVYSWRVDPELKAELEAAARAEKTSVGDLLDQAARKLLDTRKKPESKADQARRRQAFLKLIEDISVDGDGIPATNKRVREVMTANLEVRYGKKRSR